MDRSLNRDGFRLLQRWEREDHRERLPAPPRAGLAGWLWPRLPERAVIVGCETLVGELREASAADFPRKAA